MEATQTVLRDNRQESQETPAETAQQTSAGFYAQSADADGRIMVGQHVEILPDIPLPEFAGHETVAYEAKDRRSSVEMFAVLCGRHTVPRVTNIASYKNLKSPNVLRLVEAGVINWKPENRQRLAMVFEKPQGRKLLSPKYPQPYRFAEDRVIHSLIKPVLHALVEFRNADLVHGGINPDNIYIAGASGTETVILGECLSSAPSLRQHVLFESIERGMAHPAGRGQGSQKEDLYAFGMCVAIAVRGENLMAGKSETEILYEKLENGSYSAIVGRERLPSGVSEFLRGVLNDDEAHRWDVNDAIGWLEGRRMAPKPPRVAARAARPFMFKERKYWDLRSISMAFADDPVEAVSAIENEHFDLWVKRNFEDKSLLHRIEKVWERDKGGNKDKLISSLTMALDPSAPVRYKNVFAYPGGFSVSLAHVMAKNEDIQNYTELLQQQIFNNWVNMRPEEISDATGIITNFEKCRNFLTQKMPGYGMERVLYTLNKEAACMSPLLKSQFVLGAGSLLMSLETVAALPNRPDSVLDRHMIAFLSVREPKVIDPYLGHVTSPDRSSQLVGIVRTLAAIQKSFGITNIPGVGNWIISMINPAVNRFTDRDLRQEISKRLNKLIDTGNLSAILDLIDDPRLVQDDMQRLLFARKEYAALVKEHGDITNHLKTKKNFGYGTGRQVAMLISSVLGVIGILGYILLHFVQGL